MTFRTTLQLGDKTATGLEVPAKVVGSLRSGKRPAVHVTIKRHTYRSTVAPMGGKFWIPVSAENRELAGVVAGDTLEIGIELDTAPREVEVMEPADFRKALDRDKHARQAFNGLSYSNKRQHVLSIEGAKTPETRERCIAKAISALRAGKK